MRDDFGVFILTHGRADNVITYGTLKKQGYTGKVYIVINDTDPQIDEYKDRYREQVVVFSKQAAIDMTDCFETSGVYGGVVFARNYSFTLAKELGLKYFLLLDDDYSNFAYTLNSSGIFETAQRSIGSLDRIFENVLDFFISSPALTVCIAQSGDFVGGKSSTMAKCAQGREWARKAMNSFFLRVDRPFKFMGTQNEDVTTYTTLGNMGNIFLTVPTLRLKQGISQASAGGMQDLYRQTGTYVKSFYTVMAVPSSVTIARMGYTNKRLHHMVSWRHTVPEIVSEDFKKA